MLKKQKKLTTMTTNVKIVMKAGMHLGIRTLTMPLMNESTI